MDIFKIGVSIELLDRTSHGLIGMARHFNATGKAADSLQHKLHGIKMQMALGSGMMAFGGVIAGGLWKSVEAAGQLEIALKGVQVAGRFSGEDMKSLGDTVFNVSAMAATSAKEVAGFAATIESSTHLSKQQLEQVLPVFTKFADVMHFGAKNVPFEESIKAGVRFAHLTGKYDPAGLRSGLDSLFIASQFTAGTPSELIHSMQNFAPLARSLHVSEDKQIMLAALFENMGFGSKGGTILKNLLTMSMPASTNVNKFLQAKRGHALHELGLVDAHGQSTILDGKGKNQTFNVDSFITKLGEASARMSVSQLVGYTQSAFSMRGMPGAQLLAQPENAARFAEMLKQFGEFKKGAGPGGSAVENAQKELFETFGVQVRTLKTNLENIFIKTILPNLPKITAFVERMATFAATVVSHLSPGWATTMIAVATAMAGLSILGGIAVNISAVIKLIGLIGGVGSMAGAGSLVAASLAVAGPIIALVAGLGGLYLIVRQLLDIIPNGKSQRDKELKQLEEHLQDPNFGRSPEAIALDHADDINARVEASLGLKPLRMGGQHGKGGKSVHINIHPGAIQVKASPGHEKDAARKITRHIVEQLSNTSGNAAGAAGGVLESPSLKNF